ncbi:hypothetical protein, partial [Okeania sp. SIO2B9]|uniref:hypothetical protein n=1 Tax=Okeania sp. SIO2B9 TaxID=2607782 RepID=UPI00142C3D4B
EKVDIRLKELLREIAQQINVEILEMEVGEENHVTKFIILAVSLEILTTQQMAIWQYSRY